MPTPVLFGLLVIIVVIGIWMTWKMTRQTTSPSSERLVWPWPYLLFIVAVGLLLFALWFQADQDYTASRFADTYTYPITGTAMLHIVYRLSGISRDRPYI